MKIYQVNCLNTVGQNVTLTIRAWDVSEISFRIPNSYKLISFTEVE